MEYRRAPGVASGREEVSTCDRLSFKFVPFYMIPELFTLSSLELHQGVLGACGLALSKRSTCVALSDSFADIRFVASVASSTTVDFAVA